MPIAVEYELDRPIDLKQKWNFIREEIFFLQHQCGPKRGIAIAENIKALMNKHSEQLNLKKATEILQVRILRNFAAYRRAFRFSRDRHAHYNATLGIVTSYCGVSPSTLQEQLILHQLTPYPLRFWQKIFLAETLPYADEKAIVAVFSDAAKTQPKPLRYVLLSNHRPDRGERSTLRALTLFLQKNAQLTEFSLALVRERGFDDTGMEILETMFSENIQNLETQITPPGSNTPLNNTLPHRK